VLTLDSLDSDNLWDSSEYCPKFNLRLVTPNLLPTSCLAGIDNTDHHETSRLASFTSLETRDKKIQTIISSVVLHCTKSPLTCKWSLFFLPAVFSLTRHHSQSDRFKGLLPIIIWCLPQVDSASSSWSSKGLPFTNKVSAYMHNLIRHCPGFELLKPSEFSLSTSHNPLGYAQHFNNSLSCTKHVWYCGHGES